MIMSDYQETEEQMRVFKTTTAVLLTAVLSTALLIGCSTGKRVVMTNASASTQARDIGLEMSLRYLNEEEIYKRFGEKNNPFISEDTALGMNQFIVFELTVIPQSGFNGPYIVELDSIELQFGSVNTSPQNRFHITSFWDHKIKRDDRYSQWSMGKVGSVIKRSVLPNQFTVQRDGRIRQLLVFQGGFPKYGNATVYIPVLKEDGVAANVKFNLEFGYKK